MTEQTTSSKRDQSDEGTVLLDDLSPEVADGMEQALLPVTAAMKDYEARLRMNPELMLVKMTF